MVLEKTLESPLDCKEIQPVHPKGNQSWIFFRRTDAEAEVPILWPSDGKSWLIRKDPDAGENWGQEKEMTEDEMVEWHLWLDGHEFEQALRVGDGQGSLECCSPWGRKESDTTERLNWTEPFFLIRSPLKPRGLGLGRTIFGKDSSTHYSLPTENQKFPPQRNSLDKEKKLRRCWYIGGPAEK